MRPRLVPLTLPLLVLLVSSDASAGVRLETGRFQVTYSDIAYSGGLEPRIERTYSSNSQFSGIFGKGWGAEYETYLTITGYGPVIMHESGGAETKRFFPEGWSLNLVVDAIVESAKKAGDVKSPEEANNLKLRLLQEPELVDEQWNRFNKKGWLTFQDLTPGSKVLNHKFGYEEITRVSDGYVLREDTGALKKFNERGRLTRIESANNDFIEFAFNEHGNYSTIKDNFGRQLTLIYNDRHLVEKILGTGGDGPERTALFRYNEKGELVYSKDDKGGVDEFEYVSPHKLSKILFPDNTTFEVNYYGEENQSKVKSFKDNNGNVSLYTYRSDPRDQHAIVQVEVRKKNSKPVSTERHEFFYKAKPSGEKWVSREVATVDGAITDTLNDENCGCPKVIKTKAGQTSFDYDSKGRVIRKETLSEIAVFRWDDAVGKVLYTEKRNKHSRAKPVSAKFVYDARGNMTFAENSDGKKLALLHDRNGRITELTYANKRIEFSYNSNSQPTTIRVKGVATLSVDYNNSGEIKDVKSDPPQHGADAALQVSSAFDALYTIISFAKVKISP